MDGREEWGLTDTFSVLRGGCRMERELSFFDVGS